MRKKALVIMAVILMLLLTGCGDNGASKKSGADPQGDSNAAAQAEAGQEKQAGKSAKGYHIKFSKYVKHPTVDFNYKEVELLTACLAGINADIRPGQEFTHSASASAGDWSMSLKMTGKYGETKYRDGVIPALKGQMEFTGKSSKPWMVYKFSGPFVLPFATLRPLYPDHETITIGQAEVVGGRESYLEYYEYEEFKKKVGPPEAFLFTVTVLE